MGLIILKWVLRKKYVDPSTGFSELTILSSCTVFENSDNTSSSVGSNGLLHN
jgi:hypothetical protein